MPGKKTERNIEYIEQRPKQKSDVVEWNERREIGKNNKKFARSTKTGKTAMVEGKSDIMGLTMKTHPGGEGRVLKRQERIKNSSMR